MRPVIVILTVGLAAMTPAVAERPLREARFKNGRFVLEIRPGSPNRADQPCQALLFDNQRSKTGDAASEQSPSASEGPSDRPRSASDGPSNGARSGSEGPANRPRSASEGPANRAADPRTPGKPLWQRPFVNDVAAPAQAYIRDDGRFVVTLDEFRRGGARHALVIYGARGELLRHFMLTDLLEEPDWRQVKTGPRRVAWLDRAKAAFDDQYNEFVVTLASNRRVRIDLRTLQVIRPGARSLAELGVGSDVLAALADHVSGSNEPAATTGTGGHAPEPDFSATLAYLGWLKEQGGVDGPDAAPIYQAAIAAWQPWKGALELLEAAQRGDVQAMESPEIGSWLEANGAALALFREATKLGGKSWHFESLAGCLMEPALHEISQLRDLAKVNVLAGRHDLSQGRAEEAAGRYVDTIAAGAHLGSGPTMIENLMGAAFQRMAADSLLDLHADPQAGQLDWAALADHFTAAARPLRPPTETVELERAMFLDTAQRLWKVDELSGQRILDHEALPSIIGFIAEDPAELARVTQQLERTGFEQTVEEARLYYDALVTAVSQPHPIGQRQIAELGKVVTSSESANPLLKHLSSLPTWYNTGRTMAEASRRAALLVTKIRAYEQQHGSPPDSLDALGLDDLVTDPFTGRPFEYRRDALDFELLSPGQPDDIVQPGWQRIQNLRYWPRPASN